MPESKDVAIAVFGASGALAGLLLVFAGFIFAQAASFPSTTADNIVERYTKVARFAVFPFLGFLLTTLLTLGWLIHPNHCLLVFSVILFGLLVLGTGIYGAIVSYRYL